MRILLDESVPCTLTSLLPGHDVSTAQQMGWSGIDNGELLRLAAETFDVFVTADRGFEHQQNLEGVGLGVVVLVARTNRFEAYVPLADALVEAVRTLQPGKLLKVGK